MKNILFFEISFLVLVFAFSSCNSDTNIQKGGKSITEYDNTLKILTKKWVLTDGISEDTPTMIIMSLEKNGYFIIYDTIIDPKFAEAGITKIQPISKGQWRYENNELRLMHLLPESNNPEVFKVKELSSTKLITEGLNSKVHKYTAQ